VTGAVPGAKRIKRLQNADSARKREEDSVREKKDDSARERKEKGKKWKYMRL
jgi:hypothetical protein